MNREDAGERKADVKKRRSAVEEEIPASAGHSSPRRKSRNQKYQYLRLFS
jgi:hypothetical protein